MIAVQPRPAVLSPSAALGLKLYALVAMVLDHVDWLLLDGQLGFHATWGRTVFPVFAVLLAMNLARLREPGRMCGDLPGRMFAFGLLAMVPYTILQGSLLPLNVMFTLGAAVVLCGLVQARFHMLAVAFALFVGGLVDYGWFGLLAVLLPYLAFRAGVAQFLAVVVACLLLYPVNGSLWALAAVPLIVVASYVDGGAPRWKWLFYVAYPAHLAVLALLGV